MADPEYRAKLVNGVKSDERRKKNSEGMKKRWQNPEYRELQKQISKDRWKNPEYREKCISAIRAGKKELSHKQIERMRKKELQAVEHQMLKNILKDVKRMNKEMRRREREIESERAIERREIEELKRKKKRMKSIERIMLENIERDIRIMNAIRRLDLYVINHPTL